LCCGAQIRPAHYPRTATTSSFFFLIDLKRNKYKEREAVSGMKNNVAHCPRREKPIKTVG
jgi:hypothetical protein